MGGRVGELEVAWLIQCSRCSGEGERKDDSVGERESRGDLGSKDLWNSSIELEAAIFVLVSDATEAVSWAMD